MKSVTYEEFKGYGPCWLETSEGRRKLERIGRRREGWTAVDILDLPDSEVSAEDKLWAVLRPELVEEVTLHEFACRCAEEALKLVKNPDPRSIAAIKAKRKWLKGEISDEELAVAWDAANDAASAAAWDASDAARAAASVAAWDASDAASAAAWDASAAASVAAWDASDAASAAAWDASDAARATQAAMLRQMLKE